MKDRILTILKVAVSLGLMAYLLTRVDLAQIGHDLQSANYYYLLPAVVLFLGAMSSFGLKWYVLLRAQGIDIPFRAVLVYTFVGYFFNNFLPGNVGGDVMRGYGLARYTERTAEAALSVVVDRIVGLLAWMSAAAVAAAAAVWIMGRRDLQEIEVAAIVGLTAVAAGFAVTLSRRLRAHVARLFGWKLLAPLAPLYERLSAGLDAYRHSYSALALAFCASLMALVLTNFTDYFIVQSLGGGIPLIYIFLFNPIIAFVLMVPISVGGLGFTQAIYPFFYGLVGVPSTLAFDVSLLKQLVLYVTSLPGGVLWWRARDSRQPLHKPLYTK
jgi:glycosyltransferase 2 family protein